jgi:hypothetical protein
MGINFFLVHGLWLRVMGSASGCFWLMVVGSGTGKMASCGCARVQRRQLTCSCIMLMLPDGTWVNQWAGARARSTQLAQPNERLDSRFMDTWIIILHTAGQPFDHLTGERGRSDAAKRVCNRLTDVGVAILEQSYQSKDDFGRACQLSQLRNEHGGGRADKAIAV